MKEERLIIKNFGPIREVDIPIRKINVLIGNQGTGKSTVAKVLSFMKDISFIIYPTIQNSFNFFYLNRYLQGNTELTFISENYRIEYIEKKGFSVSYSETLERLVQIYKNEIESNENTASKQLVLTDITNKIHALTGGGWYIPAERLKINTPFPNVVTQNDNYFNRFSVNQAALRNLYTNFDIPFLKVEYANRNNEQLLIKNNISLPLNESATGFQNILPIILCAQQFVPIGIGTGYFVVEEPELSLFPTAQRDLINYLVARLYPLKDYMFFTTHSPYILSALNNLLYAHKVGQKKGNDVSKIISKDLWINPEDISAYILNENGKNDDLMDYEINQIKVELIDEISGVVNKEYDQLNDVFWQND